MLIRYLHGPLAGQTEDVRDVTYAEVLCQTGYAEPAPPGPVVGPVPVVDKVPPVPEPVDEDATEVEDDAEPDL
jgi:hypothetical protein